MRLHYHGTSDARMVSEVPRGIRSSCLVIAAVVLLAAGCSKAVPVTNEAPFYSGSFELSCSPVDAAGFNFDLYRLGGPQVSIALWGAGPAAADDPIRLKGSSGYGAAFVGGTEWIPAVDGEIAFDQFEEGNVASGWFWLELDGVKSRFVSPTGKLEGRFEATWKEVGPTFCG